MPTGGPLKEGNVRSVNKGNTVNPEARPNIRPTGPPPAPTPKTDTNANSPAGEES